MNVSEGITCNKAKKWIRKKGKNVLKKTLIKMI